MEKISNFPGNLDKNSTFNRLSSPPLWLSFRPAVLRKRHWKRKQRKFWWRRPPHLRKDLVGCFDGCKSAELFVHSHNAEVVLVKLKLFGRSSPTILWYLTQPTYGRVELLSRPFASWLITLTMQQYHANIRIYAELCDVFGYVLRLSLLTQQFRRERLYDLRTFFLGVEKGPRGLTSRHPCWTVNRLDFTI